MTGPLIALAGLAAVGGALNFPGLHSLTLFLEHTLVGLHAAEFNPLVAGLSTGLGLVALALAWTVYGWKSLQAGEPDPLSRGLGPLFTALNRKWYVDELYDWLFVRRYVALAGWLANTLDDRFWHDWFHDTLLARSFRLGTRWLNESFDLPVIDGAFNGLAHLTQRAANRLRTLQTGYVRNYAISVFVGLLLVMSYLLFR
jgi:NADH-quinone oxidoreductase subunit L